MSLQEFTSILEKYANKIHSWKEIISIGYVSSADAMIAASIFGRIFYTQNRPFVLFRLKDDIKKQLKNRKGSFYILIGHDLESARDLDISGEAIHIVEPFHNNTTQDNSELENIINSGTYGYVKPEITLSAISFLLCFEYADNINYIIQLALLSLQCVDMMGEYKGIMEYIRTTAEEEGHVQIKKEMSFFGSNIFSISEAITLSQTPFLPGLSGNERNVTQLLAKAEIVEETREGYRKLVDLEKDEIKSLNSEVVMFLVDYKRHQEDNLLLVKSKSILPTELKNSITHNTWDFARSLMDAINRNDIPTAMTVLMGDRNNNLKKLSSIFKEERRALSLSFDLLVDKVEDIVELKNLRYLPTDRKINWYNASLVAAMALSNGLVRIDQPFAIISPGPGSSHTIGLRASKHHKTGKGLFLEISDVFNGSDDVRVKSGSKLEIEVIVYDDNWKDIIMKINDKLGELN